VLVIGAGRLGSPALYYLAAAEVSGLGIADFDVTGISNLQRQILHFTSDIGKKKVESAFEKLTALNPDVKITTYNERINIYNIEELVKEYDVIIDAVDNFPAPI